MSIARKLMGARSPVQTSITHLDTASYNGSAVASRSFLGMDLGSEASDRFIVVGVHCFYTTPGREILSVSVGGQAATEIIATTQSVPSGSDVYTYSGLWVVDASGTSGDVFVTASAGVTTYLVSTWRLISSTSTPSVTDQRTDIGTTTSYTNTWGAATVLLTTGVNDPNPNLGNATKEYAVDPRSGEWMVGAIGDLVETSGTISILSNVDSTCIASWD